MQFNFNFEAFEKSGKDKSEAINYLKGLNSSLDFDKLESDLKGDENAIYEALKGGNFSFSKPSVEDTRQKLLKNRENEALRTEFNASLSWLDNKQDYNFYDFKKAKERANSKEGLIKADLKAQEKELKRKEALFEKRLENENILTKSLRDTADNLGLNAVADSLELGLNKLGFKDENYIFESEKEDIKKRALKSVREKLQRGDLELNEREKYALRDKYDELDYKKALEKEKEKLRLIQKDSGYNKSEVEFMEEELGFFHTLFNEAKDTVREFKDEYKSEGLIGADVQKAINVLKQFEESELLRHAFSDKKQELQQEYLKNALIIAELNGFDDVGLSRENELYFIKKDKDKEQKYLVNTGFLDNFWDLIENSKFEIAGGVAGGIKGFNSGKSAKGKVVKSVLGAAAGSFGGGLMDAKIADMYLNRESNYGRNLEYALQAGLLSIAGDGVIIAAKPMAKGVAKGVKNAYTYAKEHTPLGLFSTIPSQNINAANKIIDEVFTPEMKEELKAAQKEYGGGVRGEDLSNPVFEKLKESFAKKYGKEDKKTQKIAKLAEIFNQNSLKTKQQEMLDLIRSDKDGSTLAYLLEVAKDDVKIQNNLKNMLNLASYNVEKNLKNLNINPREIKSILDEFEAGNKAAFKEVESQISKLYNEDIRVVLDRTKYENIKKDFLENGVNLEEMTPFLRDLENNVFAKEGVTFAKLNNFRKNLNFYIFNKDKTPNFINTLKKIAETSLKAEIDRGIDNIFKELPKAYESIKELYSTSLKDYAAMKELGESIKNLKLQDSAKSADEVVESLIKYAKGQGENGVNNLQKIKAYLGEENNAFLEMQILNRLFKESVVDNTKLRVFDSEGFLNRVKELVGDSELYEKREVLEDFGVNFAGYKGKEAVLKLLEEKRGQVSGAFYKEGLGEIDLVWGNKDYGLEHILNKHGGEFENLAEQLSEIIKKGEVVKRRGRKNAYNIEHNGFKVGINQGFNQKGENKWIVTAFNDSIEVGEKTAKTAPANDFTKETHLSLNSKESIAQPLFKSKEAREFLELVEGFDKLYKNDALIAKNFTQGTASQLSTSIATSAEGAIKQKVVKGGFDPIFRLLPDGILFGLFSKQIQGGALRYHLRKALSRSLNYDDFKIKLERELKRTNFNSNTSRLIEKFMQNLEDFNAEKEAKLAQIREEEELQRQEELKRQEANNLKDILQSSKNLNANEAKELLQSIEGEELPSELSIKDFLKELESVENKENFISHLSKKEDAQSRLAYLNLIEPTLNEADLILQSGKRQDFIKKFKDEKDFFSLLITEENGKRLITFIPKTREDYIYKKIDSANLIQSFVSRASSQGNGLAKESIAQKADDFGVNFEGFKGKEAINKLLEEKRGQVKGAFYKEGLGDIDLVWGEVKGSGKEAKGYGLSKIIEKHGEDFKEFGEGLEGVSKGLDEIITKGEIHTQEYGRKTIIYHKNGDVYKVGLKQNWKGEPTKNSWVITSYKEDREADKFIHSSDFTKGETLPLNSNESIAQKADDFGVNFEGFKGKEAVLKLLEEKRGQVSGAFYKEGLGEIDLVWGDKDYGLEHILNKHGGEFENLAKELSEAVENGKIVKDDKGRLRLEYENKIVGIKDNWKGEKTAHWIVTAYVKKEKEASLYTSASFTKGETLPLNSNESIAQNTQEIKPLSKKDWTQFKRDKEKFAKKYEEAQGLSRLKDEISHQKHLKEQAERNLKEHYSDEKLQEAKNEIALAKTSEEKDRAKWWADEAFLKERQWHLDNLQEANEELEKLERELKKALEDDELKKQELNELKKELEKKNYEFYNFDNRLILALKLDALTPLDTIKNAFYYGLERISPKEALGYLDANKKGVKVPYTLKLFDKLVEITKEPEVREIFNKRTEILNKQEQEQFLKELEPALDKLMQKSAKAEQESELIDFNANIKQIKTQMLERLKPLFNQEIITKDGFKAVFNLKSLSKMTSDKAIQKSINNGFSKEKHLRAVLDIESLFKKANLVKTHEDEKGGKNVLIHRFNSEFENANALITTKESLDKNLNKIYTLELELTPRFSDEVRPTDTKSNTGGFNSQEHTADENIATITKTDEESIAQKTTKQSEKEELERQIPFIEAEIQKYEAKTARLDERIKKTQTRIQPYLDEINALQKQYDELYFTETRGEEANAKKWLKLDEIKAKQEELRKPYNDALFKFIHPYQRLKGKVQTEIQKLKFGLQDRAERLQEIQNEALTSKAQKAWLEAFGLKSMEEAYTPKFSKEVSEALERVLNGEQIKLTKGSYEKLLKRDREEFLPFIKETLESADAVVKDKENALIFVKDIGKKSYFTSVAKNANNEWVISTNSLKTLNTLKNRLDDNGELLYLSKEASNILAEAFTKRAFSNELANESIAQKNENIPHSNPHLGAGLLGGSLNGVEQDEEGNLSFDPAKFAAGFLGGSLGSKAVGVGFKHLEKNPALKEKIITELADTLAQGFDKAREKYPLLSTLEPRYIVQNERGRKIQAKVMLKELEKEQKGLFNVAYNGKNATLIKKDLEAVEEAIALMQGTRYKGAKHERIKHLTDPSKEGYITDLEFVNLGKSIREFLESYEPFIDKNRARIYEWENKDKVRFGVVVNDVADMDSNPTTATEEIITFYSDRNLKEKMKFKNPVLKVQEKFKFNPQKAKDLLEWHKDSHALTKDENGLPKVFYHGTYAKFEVFKRVGKASQQGFFFTPIQKATEQYGDTSLSTFLNIKNPFRADELKINSEADLQKWADILKLDYSKEKYERFKKIQSTLQKVKEASLKAGLKFHSANFRGVFALSRTGKDLYIDLRQLDKETKRRQEAFKPLEELFKSLDEDLGFHYVARNEFDLVLDVLNKNDKYLYGKKGRDEVKKVLEKLGYDGIILNDTIISVFDSNQIKHIDNQGSFTDSSGKVTKNKPKNSEAEHRYFNENSKNIYYSNPHLGAGLLGGSLNGVEQDEEGNLSFDPAKFAMGFLGGSLGSKAVSSGIKWRANKVKKAYPNIAKNNPVLMEQIAKRDLLTYAKNETQNALTRFLNKNKHFDSTRGLFAGEKALLNEAYAPHKARLAKAKELESKGADEIEIWEKTGWYKDKDNKWKFEISQRGGEFMSKDEYGRPYKSGWLEKILKDEELFKAYPQLRHMRVIEDKRLGAGVYGAYDPNSKSIYIKNLQSKTAKTSLYHEIQHAIQDIEGFAYGFKKRIASDEDFNKYKKQQGEVEARNVEKRLNLPTKSEIQNLKRYAKDKNKSIEILKTSDYEEQYKNLRIKELQTEKKHFLAAAQTAQEIINQGKYTDHPHKTMDTPLSETIAETTIQGEALSRELESENMDLKITKEKDFFKNLRNNAKNYLKNLKGKIVENENNGLKASISSEGINKMISVKAVDKSIKNGYTKEEHFKAVENVLNLFKISQFVRSEKANNGSVDIINYHKFNADFSINKKPSRAKITIKESYEGGNKIYSLELLELQRASK
ncbi:PBECR2 nuclease fold domain-containing protein [Campylobacter upsaliensis]|uniref:putative barnase/colicin E5 family endoribonuclease n=1 Tax=Campylobacter upsaliensis TaxID=28080 RepID=UPI0022EA77CF|nr:PBECR2 nuclease fold domain-containing protein [Campylobacter upsaliensis]